ncbi:MAG: hypothetical protein ACXVRJ_08690 [Gaiellaceae bacterium]
MAVAFIQEFAIVDGDTSTTNYDGVVAKLGLDTAPADGLIAHTAGFDHGSGVFRIFDIWENGDAAKRFYDDRLGPIIEELLANDPNAAPPEREETYELHALVH